MKLIKHPFLVLFLFSILFAEFDRSSVLIDIPTCQILPGNTFAFTLTGSFGLEKIPDYPGDRYLEESGTLRVGIGDRLELSFVAYTRRNFTLGFTYLFKPEEKRDWAFAWGIHDIGLKKDISPKGSGLERAWFDDYSYEKTAGLKPAENFSIFCVGTKPLNDFLRFHIGLGRGRYVGYGDRSKYLNTDIFFDKKHQWAFGLFGALEFHIQEFLRVGLEADGRDINFGLRGSLGPIQVASSLSKIEALIWGGNYQRLSFGISYNISAPRPRPIPPPKIPVAEKPEEELKKEPEEPKPPVPKPSLAIIYFNFDDASLRPDMEERMANNLKVLRENPDIKIVIEGHACEIGTEEYNFRLGEKRAETIYRYLLTNGIAAERMSKISYGKTRPRVPEPLSENRRVEFRIVE